MNQESYIAKNQVGTLLQSPTSTPESFPIKEQVSCIIPFYNEGSRIFNVLNALCDIKSIKEIICVDDGSTDNTSHLIQKFLPSVTLIRLLSNEGKAAAIRHGLKKASLDIVLLID